MSSSLVGQSAAAMRERREAVVHDPLEMQERVFNAVPLPRNWSGVARSRRIATIEKEFRSCHWLGHFDVREQLCVLQREGVVEIVDGAVKLSRSVAYLNKINAQVS